MPQEFMGRRGATAPTPPPITTPQYDNVSAAAVFLTAVPAVWTAVESPVDPDEIPVAAMSVATDLRHDGIYWRRAVPQGHPRLTDVGAGRLSDI